LPPGPGLGSLISVAPTRVVDTRDGTGMAGGIPASVPAFGTLTLPLADSNVDVAAAVMNVTVTGPTAPGFLTAYPSGTAAPLASNLNFLPGQTVPNLTVVPLGADGSVTFFNGSAGTIDLVVDFSGFYVGGTPTQPGTLHPVTPVRLLDTRSGNGAPQGRVAAGGTVALQVGGAGGVPSSGVSSVILNVTVTGPEQPGFITAYADGTTKPLASNLNFVPNQTVPNLVIVPVGSNGIVDLFNGSAGQVDLVADVFGYMLGGTVVAAGSMQSLPPTRVLDTRVGNGAPTATVPAGGSVTVQLTGRAGVPNVNVSAVVLNITATGTTAPGYVTAFGSSTDQPLASNLNFQPGQTVPNLAVVPVGSDGAVTLYNGSAGPLDLVADISGYYLSGGGVIQAIGNGANGDLGNGLTNNSASPVLVNGLTGITAVAAKGDTGYALDADGLVWGWGYGGDGELATGSADGSALRPVPLYAAPVASAIASGWATGYALATDGTVWAWGAGDRGQLGDGTTSAISAPVQVTGLTDIVAVAATDDTAYAVTSTGSVYAWGAGDRGQLGAGTTDSSTPVLVPGLSNVTAVAGGSATAYALLSDGTVWSWGAGDVGQLGRGSTVATGAPAQITTLSNIESIASGPSVAYALRADGTVWSWGDGTFGQLGDGADEVVNAPVQVSNLTTAVSIAASSGAGYAVRADGTVVGWGVASDSAPFLGTATNSPSNVPVAIPGLSGVYAIAGSNAALYAIVGIS